MKVTATLLTALTTLALVAGCGQTQVERFRAAAPSAQDLQVRVPSATAQQADGAAVQALSAAAPGKAFMPGVTWLAGAVVNGSVAYAVTAVGAMVLGEPTEVSPGRVVWGPYTEPLWREEWRLVMEENGDDVFDYTVEARPRASSGAFVAVMTGKHTFRQGGAQGELDVDFGAYVALDNPQAYQGRAHVTYARSAAGDQDVSVLFLQPAQPGGRETSITYGFVQRKGGEGALTFVLDQDFDARTAAKERLSVTSRWQPSGAGRADARVAGGDVLTPFTFSECWAPTHVRAYYADSAGLFPAEGAEAACVFTSATFPSS